VVVDLGNSFWGFKNLTFCPYDRNLLDLKLLNSVDLNYINEYHLRVRDLLIPELKLFNDPVALQWLEART
jgi:Xaa-Pro aminopeptidase